MAIKKHRTSTGGNKFTVTGSALLQFDCTMPSGALISVSLAVGNRGVDGREYFAIDVMHDPATDIEFERSMPQSVTVRGRLPKKETRRGIMDSSADWKVGKTQFKDATCS
jgi:hypothetical protein